MDAPLQLELAKALDTLALLVGLGGFFLGAFFGHVLRRISYFVLDWMEARAVAHMPPDVRALMQSKEWER